jgi:hypothetical protein
MDSFREQSDFDLASAEPETEREVALSDGGDERRMHVRAYNYWVSLLDGRDFPSIEDLEPQNLTDFSANSVLLDFTCGGDNPATPYIGAAVREECGLTDGIRTISEVPSRSLLSRLTDHYMQIIANRAPVGFEAEFDNQRGEPICYRGILMPFSSDGDAIDFIYGVINWKRGDKAPINDVLVPQLEPQPAPSSTPLREPLDQPASLEASMIAGPADAVATSPEEAALKSAHRPLGGFAPLVADQPLTAQPDALASRLDADPIAEASAAPLAVGGIADVSAEDDIPAIELDEDAGLADRLWAARETAEVVKSADGRSRAALYAALALAYDFAVAAQSNPEDYTELLQESGVKAQARAPMTPIVKLVFGIDYDKTRLTEFAAALSHAQRHGVDLGEFGPFIQKQPGGLKALVAAERQAKRPEPRPDTRLEAALERLRAAAPIALEDLLDGQEFALVVTRRNGDGQHEIVAAVDDENLVQRALRRFG